MAQFARPDADLEIGSWAEDDDTTDALFGEIDEATRDDLDFDKSEDLSAPGNTTPFAVSLSDITDPVSSAGHIIRVALRKQGTAQMDATVELRQGYVSEASPGTLIATLTQANLTTSFAEYTHTLSGAEADAITDYTDLQLRFVGTYV